MKKLITLFLFATLATAASAQHRCCYRYGPGFGWVAPAVVGGVIGYELAQPKTVIIEQPPVYVQQPVVQAPPLGYHWQEMIDPQTNTKKIVLVPNQ